MDVLQGLNQLFSRPMGSDTLLWVSASEPNTAFYLSDLRRQVSALQKRLATNEAQAVLLYTEHPMRFTTGLLALLGVGKQVVLCANKQAGWLAGLQDRFQAALSDENLGLETPSLSFPFPEKTPATVSEEDAGLCGMQLDGSEPMLFLTSGSTGDAKPIRKTLQALSNEVETLLQSFPQVKDSDLICASVSHLHIYGLLFRILLPLISGRPSLLEPIEFQEQLLALAARHTKPVFVSSPAFLSRLDCQLQAIECLQVFSSGGPLPLQAARDALHCFAALPVEVYGSTETGGIAWRQQEQSTSPWQPFPGVILEQGGEEVWLTSPNMPGQPPYALDDRLQLGDDGRFTLLGRKDRIAKIEEKRVSLTAIERFLEQFPEIEQCVVMVLENGRQVIGCALLLTNEGRHKLSEFGMNALVRGWKRRMRGHFDAVTIPRKWRIMDSVPLTTQGKIDHGHLLTLFGRPNSQTLGEEDIAGN